ncbi:flagellin [Chthonobacter rhizosphaerae]|uniref:flagellin N-terminal helical domain-containing protein n=1 Tax=Chthonobacter rhizosphaerae TaxID=2735553 RepID=UPI0015EFCC98|nr:flagellin [Chthonobacter rhizosphaerae]
MSVTLAAGVRANLLALQQTSSLQEVVQNRLATGKKVNSALDNPGNYFTAAALSDRANDLNTLLDDMGQAVQTLKAADEGIKAIQKLVDSAKAKANQALASASSTDRATFASEYNNLLSQITDIAEDSGYKGKNLLKGDSLKVIFNERTGEAQNSLTISGVSYTDVSNLSLTAVADPSADWATGTTGDTAINDTIDSLNSALTNLRTQASTFGTNLSSVQIRQDYTKSMINTLQTGADKLTLADQNEEGAKLLALNTRQQLSSTALSFASQADQNVLRLLG